MKKFIVLICSILVFLFLFGCGNSLGNNESNTDTENNNSSDLVEDSNTEQEPKEVVCSCPNCQYPITLGDAILIAQNHYFATETPSNLSTHVMTAKDISKITGDSEDRWYILISEECIGKCGDEIHKVLGGGYLYVIDKNTGEIVDKELQE